MVKLSIEIRDFSIETILEKSFKINFIENWAGLWNTGSLLSRTIVITDGALTDKHRMDSTFVQDSSVKSYTMIII